eukprot:159955_1
MAQLYSAQQIRANNALNSISNDDFTAMVRDSDSYFASRSRYSEEINHWPHYWTRKKNYNNTLSVNNTKRNLRTTSPTERWILFVWLHFIVYAPSTFQLDYARRLKLAKIIIKTLNQQHHHDWPAMTLPKHVLAKLNIVLAAFTNKKYQNIILRVHVQMVSDYNDYASAHRNEDNQHFQNFDWLWTKHPWQSFLTDKQNDFTTYCIGVALAVQSMLNPNNQLKLIIAEKANNYAPRIVLVPQDLLAREDNFINYCADNLITEISTHPHSLPYMSHFVGQNPTKQSILSLINCYIYDNFKPQTVLCDYILEGSILNCLYISMVYVGNNLYRNALAPPLRRLLIRYNVNYLVYAGRWSRLSNCMSHVWKNGVKLFTMYGSANNDKVTIDDELWGTLRVHDQQGPYKLQFNPNMTPSQRCDAVDAKINSSCLRFTRFEGAVFQILNAGLTPQICATPIPINMETGATTIAEARLINNLIALNNNSNDWQSFCINYEFVIPGTGIRDPTLCFCDNCGNYP